MCRKLTILMMAILLISGCATSQLNKINDNIDKVQDDIRTVVENTEGAEPIDVVRTAWDASRLWNPYWGYGSAAFLILEMLRKRKKDTV